MGHGAEDEDYIGISSAFDARHILFFRPRKVYC